MKFVNLATDDNFVQAKVGINFTNHSYWSVTGQVGKDMFGCCHEEILKVWPELQPFVDLHLSYAETGIPMHAVANAVYWLSGTHKDIAHFFRYNPLDGSFPKTEEQSLLILEEHLRTTELPFVLTALQFCQAAKSVGSDKEEVANFLEEMVASFVEAQKPRWLAESNAAHALLNKLLEKVFEVLE